MNEGNGTMTAMLSTGSAGTFMDTGNFSGVPGVAVRLGRALEIWGRQRSLKTAAHPIDRDARRREYDRQLGNETRMLQMERLGLQHR